MIESPFMFEVSEYMENNRSQKMVPKNLKELSALPSVVMLWGEKNL